MELIFHPGKVGVFTSILVKVTKKQKLWKIWQKQHKKGN
jgi:hypothetical protein